MKQEDEEPTHSVWLLRSEQSASAATLSYKGFLASLELHSTSDECGTHTILIHNQKPILQSRVTSAIARIQRDLGVCIFDSFPADRVRINTAKYVIAAHTTSQQHLTNQMISLAQSGQTTTWKNTTTLRGSMLQSITEESQEQRLLQHMQAESTALLVQLHGVSARLDHLLQPLEKEGSDARRRQQQLAARLDAAEDAMELL
jgi:hypothetical protein